MSRGGGWIWRVASVIPRPTASVYRRQSAFYERHSTLERHKTIPHYTRTGENPFRGRLHCFFFVSSGLFFLRLSHRGVKIEMYLVEFQKEAVLKWRAIFLASRQLTFVKEFRSWSGFGKGRGGSIFVAGVLFLLEQLALWHRLFVTFHFRGKTPNGPIFY